MALKPKQKANRRRHKFLIETFFEGRPDGYAVKNVGNWVLVKQWNGGSNMWEVAIWERDTFNRVQDMRQKDLF